jgi:hypothetical protein
VNEAPLPLTTAFISMLFQQVSNVHDSKNKIPWKFLDARLSEKTQEYSLTPRHESERTVNVLN